MSSRGAPQGSDRPRLVVVAGSGRSGTSTISGVLSTLGLYVPLPAVAGTYANPKGHFEPEWVVDFQQRLLERAHVRLADARPEAIERAEIIGAKPGVQERLQTWLASQVALAPEIVIKDPRNSYFLQMWSEAAEAVSASACFLTMLRHPAEVLGSKNSYYHPNEEGERRRIGDTSRLAGWINVALFTEFPTRELPRAFVRYTDLVADWRTTVLTLAKVLDLSPQHGFDEDSARKVDGFIDPDLHRVKGGWDHIDVPDVLRTLSEQVWEQLNQLADTNGRDAEAEAQLDEARRRYQGMYSDAYALTSSSVVAEKRAMTARANRAAQEASAHRVLNRGRAAVGRLVRHVGSIRDRQRNKG